MSNRKIFVNKNAIKSVGWGSWRSWRFQIAPIHLKHLGSQGIHFHTVVINQSIRSSNIPERWKIGRIIPLLKPGKSADQGKSYRPIALLSPVVKLVERLLLPFLQNHLPLADHQHGFREGHSTVTALNCLMHNICRGFNRPSPNDRTVPVALDLTAAFDTVDHEVLLEDIMESPLPNYIKRWLLSYLPPSRGKLGKGYHKEESSLRHSSTHT